MRGEVLDEVKAPADGMLFTIREYPVVDEGSLMGRILKRRPVAMNKRIIYELKGMYRDSFGLQVMNMGQVKNLYVLLEVQEETKYNRFIAVHSL